MPDIIATVGMPGSGKSTATDYLEHNDFFKVYFGAAVIDEVKKRGLAINEANEKIVRVDIRQKYGMAAMAKLSLHKIREGLAGGKVVIDGLYSWEEFECLKDEFGDRLLVVAIVAPKKLRYQRLENRPIRPLTYEEVLSRDLAQIKNLNVAGPIAIADYTIVNDGDLNSYYRKIDIILKEENFGRHQDKEN